MTYNEYIKWLDEPDKRTVKHRDLLELIIDKDLASRKLSKSKFAEFEKKYNEQLNIKKSYAMTAAQINVIMDRILPEFVSFKLTNVCNHSLLVSYGESNMKSEKSRFRWWSGILWYSFVNVLCYVFFGGTDGFLGGVIIGLACLMTKRNMGRTLTNKSTKRDLLKIYGKWTIIEIIVSLIIGNGLRYIAYRYLI